MSVDDIRSKLSRANAFLERDPDGAESLIGDAENLLARLAAAKDPSADSVAAEVSAARGKLDDARIKEVAKELNRGKGTLDRAISMNDPGRITQAVKDLQALLATHTVLLDRTENGRKLVATYREQIASAPGAPAPATSAAAPTTTTPASNVAMNNDARAKITRATGLASNSPDAAETLLNEAQALLAQMPDPGAQEEVSRVRAIVDGARLDGVLGDLRMRYRSVERSLGSDNLEALSQSTKMFEEALAPHAHLLSRTDAGRAFQTEATAILGRARAALTPKTDTLAGSVAGELPYEARRALDEIDKALADVRAALAEQVSAFERVDLSGDGDHRTGPIRRDIESKASHGHRVLDVIARQWLPDAEKGLPAGDPRPGTVRKTSAELAAQLDAQVAAFTKRIAFAESNDRVKSALDNARSAAESATAMSTDGWKPQQWPRVLRYLADAEAAWTESARILPAGERPTTIDYGARIADERRTARAKLVEVATTEARRLHAGNPETAQEIARTLAETLPDAPEASLLAAELAGAGTRHAEASAELERRAATLLQRAAAAAHEMRPRFDAWKSSLRIVELPGAQVVARIGDVRGQFVSAAFKLVGTGLADDFMPIQGEPWFVEWDETLREELQSGARRLERIHDSMVASLRDAHQVPSLAAARAYYVEQADLVCEISGVKMFTPIHEVRDDYGRLLKTVTGTPYPVPSVIARGVASTLFVVVPGEGSSIDGVDPAL